MKKFTFKTLLFSLLVVCSSICISCGGEEKIELSKKISSDRVSMVGVNRDLLKVTSDSVEVKLIQVNPNDDIWGVVAVVPMGNTTPWNKVPGTNQKAEEFFYPSMNYNISAVGIDKNDTEVSKIDFDIYEEVETILSSNELIEDDIRLTFYSSKKYADAKSIYDLVDGIKFTGMELNKGYNQKKTETKSTGYDDIEDAVEDMYDAYEDAIDAVYDDAVDEAIDAYEDAINEIFGF